MYATSSLSKYTSSLARSLGTFKSLGGNNGGDDDRAARLVVGGKCGERWINIGLYGGLTMELSAFNLRCLRRGDAYHGRVSCVQCKVHLVGTCSRIANYNVNPEVAEAESS